MFMLISDYSLKPIENPNKNYLQEWRDYEFSLTDKLNACAGNSVLEVLSQQWNPPSWWNRHFLKIDELVFERNIIMRAQDKACWFARTIIPETCFNLDPFFFKRLEKESVRNLIFNESRVCRLERSVYPVDKKCIEFGWIKPFISSENDIIWARLAKFSFHKTGFFYLVELLFPELESIK
ncbi:MAG: chorismate lyase [Legionella sp.]|nr:chorismate lyase [Legionella sp.]